MSAVAKKDDGDEEPVPTPEPKQLNVDAVLRSSQTLEVLVHEINITVGSDDEPPRTH